MKINSPLLLTLFCLSLSLPAAAHDSVSAEKLEKPISGESIYNLQSNWVTQEGKTINISSLRGQPVVTALIYTGCKSMCPVAVEDMQAIEAEISKQSREPVRFVLFSMDPAKDTPARLKEFAKPHNIDLKHWVLLHGEEKAVRNLSAVLGVRYRRNRQGEFEHSDIISLLDREGVIVYQRNGSREDLQELVNKLKQLVGVKS